MDEMQSYSLIQRNILLVVLLLAPFLYQTSTYADGTPRNLADGLYEIVQESQASPALQQSLVRKPTGTDRLSKFALKDEQGRFMVDVHLDGTRSIAAVRAMLLSQKDVTFIAEDHAFQAGTIEAYMTPAAAADLAQKPGIAALSLVWKPKLNIGAVTTQGFIQHRVNDIAGKYTGAGVKVGVLSDSYDSYASSDPAHDAAVDISTGDLPGPGNPYGNTTPVTVLDDTFVGGTDEGRAMLQIVTDIAPKAQLGFATAATGYIQFANNIRALKDKFGAEVICDDVQYYEEPMFQDGPIAQAVDYLASKGVAYFSAAGNSPGIQGYAATFNWVDPAHPKDALKGTNINLTGVDPSLYAGGFHNFRTDGGQDIAQELMGGYFSSGGMIFQWNDPYAYVSYPLGKLLLNSTGDITTINQQVSFPLDMKAANTLVQIELGPTKGSAVNANVAIIDPKGKEIFVAQSRYTPQEVALPLSGTYTVVVSGAFGSLGEFYVKVNKVNVTPSPRISCNYNLLFFDEYGSFIAATTMDAIATKQPAMAIAIPAYGKFQLVIARSNIPTGPHPADQLRYVLVQSTTVPLDYFSFSSPTTYGHNCANGANGVAAYSAFRPFAPEPYTSPGPATIYFDDENNKLSTPEVRQRPNFAGMDGAYTTFFGSMTGQDTSTYPNFFGTSAATPHAAAIAALVLEAHGGSGSVRPEQMRQILEKSTFDHALTPYYAEGLAYTSGRTVLIQANGDDNTVSEDNPDQYTIQLFGKGSISSLSIDLHDADPTAGNIYKAYQGQVFDPRPQNPQSGAGGFPFTVGSDSVGITNSDVTAAFDEQAPAPSVKGQCYRVKLNFTPNKLVKGAILRFGVARLEQHSSYSPTRGGTGGGTTSGGGAADLLGQGVLLPSGQFVGIGAAFSGTLDDGTPFQGTFTNKIGPGWTPVDGYGFINAQKAVSEPLP
jgi:hypothetical protein